MSNLIKKLIYKVFISLKIIYNKNGVSIRKNYQYYKISRVKKKIYLSYKKGYNFHKKLVLKNSDLMTWVKNKEYY